MLLQIVLGFVLFEICNLSVPNRLCLLINVPSEAAQV